MEAGDDVNLAMRTMVRGKGKERVNSIEGDGRDVFFDDLITAIWPNGIVSSGHLKFEARSGSAP